MTDENWAYTLVGRDFAGHGVVKHMHGEYVSKVNPEFHTNTQSVPE